MASVRFSFNYLPPGIFFMLFSGLLIFFKINFFKKFFQEYHLSVNRLDPDLARHFVGPNLGPNCLQKLSAVDTRR